MSESINESDDWARVTVNLEPELKKKLKARAKKAKRSMAAHVAWLIERDLNPRIEEPRAGYGEELDQGKPPDDPSQHPGAGPAAEISA